jgi:type IX secretion system PorP/SprF family membrane protein
MKRNKFGHINVKILDSLLLPKPLRLNYLYIVILTIILSTFKYTYVSAQSEEQSSMYIFNPLLFNPAYAGTRGTVSAVGIARFQWVGIHGAPRSQFVSVHAPIGNQNLSWGAHLSNDQIGARSRTSAFGDVAYSLRLNKKNDRISFGLSAGIDWQVYDFNRLVTNDPNDPVYNYYASKVRPNFGAGVYYYGDKHYFGVSIPRLLQNKLNDGVDIGEGLQRRHFYITGGYVFKLNSALMFKPNVLIKIAENSPTTIDINANFLILNTLWIGPMYRFHESIGLSAAINVKDFMMIGYAYDFQINGLSGARINNAGTHEIMVTFDLKPKKKAFISPRYF